MPPLLVLTTTETLRGYRVVVSSAFDESAARRLGEGVAHPAVR